MAVYGRAYLVSDFKLTWENDDLLSTRHLLLRYCTLCTRILNCRFLTKGIKLTQFKLKKVLTVSQLGGTSV